MTLEGAAVGMTPRRLTQRSNRQSAIDNKQSSIGNYRVGLSSPSSALRRSLSGTTPWPMNRS
jgi:hypothetical protein